VTVQDIDRVPAGGEVHGNGQNLRNPIGDELVRRDEMPGLTGEKRYGLFYWEGYRDEQFLEWLG